MGKPKDNEELSDRDAVEESFEAIFGISGKELEAVQVKFPDGEEYTMYEWHAKEENEE